MSAPDKLDYSVVLSGLVGAALEGDAREGITNLLKEIASITRSFGCVLWRATPNAKPPEEGRLTMLAAWFKADKSHFGIRDVAFDDTVSGKAASDQKHGWEQENDLRTSGNRYANSDFFKKHDLNRVVACRIKYLARAGEAPRLGAVVIFRKSTDALYSEEDVFLLRQIAGILPYLYSGARQKASYGLLKEVAKVLRDARKVSKPGHLPSKQERKKMLGQVATALEGTFHSFETSIFLEDERHPGEFTCAYSAKGPCASLVKNSKYRPTDSGGFSPLCLLAREPIRVHDQLNSQTEFETWRKRFPKFNGPSRSDLAPHVLKALGNPDPPPPLSMMVAPLLADGEVLGFLRCWAAKSGPAYFSSDDLELLQLVADYLSQTVAAWRQELRTVEAHKREHKVFKDFAQTGQAVGKNRDEARVYLATLGMVRQLLPEAAFNTIRLRRSDPERLDYYGFYILPTYGLGGDELSKRLVGLSQKLPAETLAAKALGKKQPRVFRGAQLTRHPTDVAVEAGEMIVAPIIVNDQVEAVLDLRTAKGQKFSPHALAVTGSITVLLALQMEKDKAEQGRLILEQQKFAAQLQADRDRASTDKNMREAFEDLYHQIKSPLAEAARRVEEASRRYQHSPAAQDLHAVTTLLRRAEWTAKLIGLFASFARGQTPKITGDVLTPVDLVKLAGEVCENQRPRISERRNIRIELDADSLYRHAPASVKADRELLLQSLNNLVDNAVKYSYPNTVIRVFCNARRQGGFAIGVSNKGIPIRPHEVNLVRQRNWRGDQARASSGEGNGLGLWIVDRIMAAHGGELHVLPTRPSDGITEMRLAFPSTQ